MVLSSGLKKVVDKFLRKFILESLPRVNGSE